MRWLGAAAGIDEAELRATVNGGLGLVVAVPPTAVATAVAAFAAEGLMARHVGTVVEAVELGGRRYAEAPLPAAADEGSR